MYHSRPGQTMFTKAKLLRDKVSHTISLKANQLFPFFLLKKNKFSYLHFNTVKKVLCEKKNKYKTCNKNSFQNISE